MKKVYFLLLTIMLLILTGCKPQDPVSKTAYMLNTFVTITLYDTRDEGILDGCLELCESYEQIFSRTIETSEIYRLNHRKPEETVFTVSDDTARLIEKGLYYSRISGGAFDITVEPITTLWDFTSGEHRIPDESALKEAVKKVGYQNLQLEGNQLTFLSPDTALELGAIAKGYIADRLKDYLLENGVKSAVINLGGNVLCVGEKPGKTPFKIGLQKPFADHTETIETMDIRDMSVVSSGVYERHFVIDGVNYHHILDPKTGCPYQNGLISVTILSGESVDGDGLSTTCFSLGLDKGMELADSIDGVYAVFITEDGKVHYSEGAARFLAK
ncbi:MAG: FAD:protein FMN transferase [Clostridiaceae bacterium]|nr:FAD:protein FMN transferase [Clostridiaceae bacterium]